MDNMSAPTYKITFSGAVLNGHNPSDVSTEFAKAFKITDQLTLKRLFSGKLITLKSGLSHERAQHYQNILTNLGVDSCIEPEKSRFLTSNSDVDRDYERRKRQRMAQFAKSVSNELSLTPK